VVHMRRGPDLIMGSAERLPAKWTAAARVLSSPSAKGATYIDLRLPERPAAGGLPTTSLLPLAPAGSDAGTTQATPDAATTGTTQTGTSTTEATSTGTATTPAPATTTTTPSATGTTTTPTAPSTATGTTQTPSAATTGGGQQAPE
jgi:hypothetical protein